MCCEDMRDLSFETLFTDPLIRLVMESDGVTARDLADALHVASGAIGAWAPMAFASRSVPPVSPPVSLRELVPLGHC